MTTTKIALVALGFLLLAPRIAPAANCRTGCGFASGACVRAGAVDKVGCGTSCKTQWKADLAACRLNETDCEAERLTYHSCRDTCISNGKSAHTQCLNDRAACDASCNAETDELCADGCGSTTPITSYKACVLPVGGALPGCRNGCNHVGGCIQGCATTARAQIAACKATFDSCLAGCL
jgi:hypothetical protein